MTVGKLKQFLKSMPDDALVVRPGDDHSYITVRPGLAQAVHAREYDIMFEYYDSLTLAEDEHVIEVVVFE